MRGSLDRMASHVLTLGLVLIVVAGCAASVSPSHLSPGPLPEPPAGSTAPEWAAASLPTIEMSARNRAEIDTLALDALASHGDGATAIYIGFWDPHRGAYLHAYGESSPGVPATLADHNRIGSVTKTFTAVAVLELVAGGRIALTDTLAKVLPDLSARFPAIAPLTVDQLLGMRTGIGDFFCCPNGFTDTFYADPGHPFSIDDLVGFALAMRAPPPVAPTTADYSNTNYVLLGEVIRVVTGRPASEVITDVARSVGLRDTALPADGDRQLPQPAAHGYMGPQFMTEHHDLLPPGPLVLTDVSDWIPIGVGAAGAMYSTVGDLGAWAASGYGSALLPPDLVDARLNPPGGQDFTYGYGIVRVGKDWLGHGGSVDGWVIDTAYNRATGAAWVMIVNASGGEGVLEGLAKLRPEFTP